MSTDLLNSYQSNNRIDSVAWITDPTIPDPENLPVPLGWCVLIRPYPVSQNQERTKILLATTELDFMNHVTNIGRVVAVGPCAWNRPEHRMKDGTQKDWVQVGDFVSYPKNVGSRRKYKGVSYVLLVDDEINEQLPDPQVFNEGFFKINIPQEHLEKYNTVYKKGNTE
jgi:co-chaperonin GroES (HSP10)